MEGQEIALAQSILFDIAFHLMLWPTIDEYNGQAKMKKSCAWLE